jgi:flagellar hook-associated protein 2
VLSGVTLNLAIAAPDTPVQLTIANDTSQAATTLNNFITAYNTVIKDINTQYTADGSGNEGPLASDSSLRTLQTQLMAAVTYSIKGTGQFVNLHSLGVEMQNDGALKIDTATVTDTLTNHFADFQNFFQSAAPVGFGQNMGKLLLSATDPTQGVIGLDIQGLQNTSKSITKQISDFEQRMMMVQKQLSSQYSTLNVLLQQYSSHIAQVNSQLSSLDPRNSNS